MTQRGEEEEEREHGDSGSAKYRLLGVLIWLVISANDSRPGLGAVGVTTLARE